MSKKKFNIDQMKKDSVFKTPPGYFDKLPNMIESRIAQLEDEEEIVLNPEIFKRELPFTVPDGYFNDLPMTVSAQINNAQPERKVALVRPQLAWSVPALMIMLFVGYILFFNQSPTALSADDLLAQASTEELIDYLEISEMTTEELLEGINLNEIASELGEQDPELLNEIELSDEDLDNLYNEYDLSGDIL